MSQEKNNTQQSEKSIEIPVEIKTVTQQYTLYS